MKKKLRFLIYFLLPVVLSYFFLNDFIEYVKENFYDILFLLFLHSLALLITGIIFFFIWLHKD